MKTILVSLLLLSLASCGLFPADGRGYVVISMGSWRPGIAEYTVFAVKGQQSVIFRDSIGKFSVGDTLIFSKKPR
jgi:hypothetical protein